MTTPDQTRIKWWRDDLTPSQRAEAVSRSLGRIIAAQSRKRDETELFARMYSNHVLPGQMGKVDIAPRRDSLSLNVVKSCVDTFAATLTKEKPKVMFQTSGGDWDLQERAQDLTKFVHGQFTESKVYEKNVQLALDCGMWGTGIYKPFISGDGKKQKIQIDRVLPIELHADDQEAAYGKPRSIYQTRWVDRDVLADMFTELADKINAATREYDKISAALNTNSISDQLLVVEAWHLQPHGRHVMCLYNGMSLLDEEYERERLPFIFYRRSPAPAGLWGIGLAEELKGIQLEINILLRKIQRSHKLLAAGHWMVEASSMVQPAQIDDQIGSIIRYRGIAPQLAIGQAIAPEVYKHLWDLYQRAFEITGISQLQAQAQKPAGLDSGEAQRVYLEAINVRAQIAQDNFHSVHLELAEHIIDLAKEITKTYPDFSARAVSGSSMSRVRFLDTDLDQEEYLLQMFPTNALADDPAMRMAQVQELAQVGWIGEDDAKRLLNFPDLESWSAEQNASHDVVEDIISEIMHDGEYKTPEPFMNLQEAIGQVQRAYLLNRRKNAPKDRLELLRTWIQQAEGILNPPQPPPPPPPAGGPPGPGGPGAPAGPGGPPGGMPPSPMGGPGGGPPPMPMNGGSPMSPVGPAPLPPGGPPR